MGAHIFVASQKNFEKCIQYGVYGGIAHKLERISAEVIAGFESIRPGDLVFFYVLNVGIRGLWKVTTRPFYDTRDIWGNPDQVYPYRICFDPAIRSFPKPVALSDILDLRDKGKVWTFDFSTTVKKSHQPITALEASELIRLLLRNNPVAYPVVPSPNPLSPVSTPLPIKLVTDSNGRVKYEGYLNAWLMRALSNNRFRHMFGEYRDFLNFVPTSFNTVMDVFMTHVTPVDSIDILHKFTCVELKTDIASLRDLNQILKYENWLIRKLADGESEMVQSILLAFDFEERVLAYVLDRRNIEEKTVRLLTYRVVGPDELELSER